MASAVATFSIFSNLITPTTAQSSFTPVTGPSGVANRYPVDTLRTSYPDVWNMYILGLAAMQALPETHPLSYYQLSGIHGVPFIPWEEATSPAQDPTRGYCTHGSALFATWHRPYLSLIEQRLTQNAINEANKFSGATKTRMVAAAEKVRLPYWDWASADTKSHIPAIVMQTTISVTKYTSTGAAQTTTITNPLYSYKFANDQYRQQYFSGNFRNWDTTRRQPDNNGNSQQALADSSMAAGYSTRKQNTYNLFSIPNFSGFSNTDPNLDGTPNQWTSLESIHNDIHVQIGGNNGHMTMLAYSSFDPIFWLHHANVDRLTAIYQSIHYGKFVTPQPASGTFARRATSGSTDTVNTQLNPFRHADGSYFTSVDVSWASSIWHFGYAYVEVPYSYRGKSHDSLAAYTTSKVNALYGPNSAAAKRDESTSTERREYLVYAQFQQAEVYGSAEVLVFLDGEDGATAPIAANSTYETTNVTTSTGTAPLSTATATGIADLNSTLSTGSPLWSNGTASYNGSAAATNPRLSHTCLGEVVSFANKGEKPMAHIIRGTVPLSDALEKLGISLSTEDSVTYLEKHLSWAVMQGDTLIPLSSVPSLKVGVASSVVQYPKSPEELPTWGEFETHYQVTHGKAGGMTTSDHGLADTTPAVCVGGASYGGSMPLPEGYEQIVKVVQGDCTCAK